jgi:hypothetical protein
MIKIYHPEQSLFLYDMVDRYSSITGQRYYTRVHSITKADIAILPLPVQCTYGGLEWQFWGDVKMGLRYGVKIIIDWSWEQLNVCTQNPSIGETFWFKHKDFLVENNIRILTQCWDSSIVKDNWDYDLQKLAINLSTFEFNVRLCHEMNNAEYRLMAAPVEKKKFLLNYIPGDIRKYPSSLMLHNLLKILPEDEVFYSKVIGDWFHPYTMGWGINDFSNNNVRKFSPELQHLWREIYDNQREFHTHKPFEEIYGHGNGEVDGIQERRIPPAVYESEFSVIQECSWEGHFFTEKTFKHIMAERPFIIHASPGTNTAIRQFGYEIYDELFDFSQDHVRSHRFHDNIDTSHKRIINAVERLKDNRELFNLASVKEKTQHNRHNLLRRTTTKAFETELERIFDS